MQNLDPDQEKYLVKYIEKLCKEGLPPTKDMIRNFAAEIAKKEIGKNWPDRFVERQKLELVSRWTMAMDQARHKADSAKKYEHYFDLMGRKMEEYKIKPWLMYNVDEKGFLIGVLTKTK